MPSFFKKKGVQVAAIVTAAVLLCVAIAHFGGSNPVSAVLRTVFAPFQNGAAYITHKVSDTVDFVIEMKSYKDENEKLVREMNELKKENKDITNYREENERLRDLLELQESLADYTTIPASVIAYSASGSYDTVQISRGSLAGVSVGDAVITSDGVVGKVTETGLTWSVVSTILSPGNAMGVRVTRTDNLAVVEGDSETASEGYCRMSFIDKGSSLIIGDLLETSGASGVYPPGILVGSVREISSDTTGNLNYATIEPMVDFDRLYEVLVVSTRD